MQKNEMNVDQLISMLMQYFNVAKFEDLGEKLGVTQSAVSNWRARGNTSPILKKIEELKIDLNLPVFKGKNNNQIGHVNGVGIQQTLAPKKIKVDLKNIDVYVKLEQLAQMGGQKGQEALSAGLESVKNELIKYI